MLALCKLKSTAPMSMSKYNQHMPALENESADERDRRLAPEHCDFSADGHVVIYGLRFKLALDRATQMDGRKIKGRGNSTFTKHFMSGVIVDDPCEIVTDLTRDTVVCEPYLCGYAGIKGGKGPKVIRHYPVIPAWAGTIGFRILDPVITQDVFTDMLNIAGCRVGIGRWRPEVAGMKGRFRVEDIAFVKD